MTQDYYSRLKPVILTSAFIPAVVVFLTNSSVRADIADSPASGSFPPAPVAKVAREDLYQQVTISAEFRPYVEAELNAKVSGYVNRMDVDFGDKVKSGQLIATLEVPELQDDLLSAQAAEKKAEADHTNADLIYTRLLAVNQAHPNLVAEQDLDTAQASDQTTTAAIVAARANVQKYQTLLGYTQIIAPFDGVITRRYADPGQLIQAGTSSFSQARPLVRVSDNYHLRLDFPVTVDYVKDIQLGDPVTVQIQSLNNKILTGAISRFTRDVDDNTRTMMAEIEVPNPDLELVPGMYATVVLKVQRRSQALAIPVEAVSSGESNSVFVINKNSEIEDRAVKLGLEMPDKYEVLSGLSEGDLVVVGNRSQFQVGEKVEPKLSVLTMTDEN